MARLLACDSCGKTSEDKSLQKVYLPGNPPSAVQVYGGGGWSVISFSYQCPIERDQIMSDGQQAVGMGMMPHLARTNTFTVQQAAAAPEGPFFTELFTTLDFCPECTQRMFQATGCIDKIQRSVPRPAPMEDVEIDAEVVQPRPDAKSAWDHVMDKDETS